jgi:hypothetical protein
MKTLTNKIVWIAVLLIAIAIGIVTFQRIRPPQLPPVLVSIEKMGHLVALKVNVADVIEFTEDSTFDIPWSLWQVKYGATKVLLIVRGDCSVATDLRAATYESIDQANRSVTIVLKSPAVLQPRVIHASPDKGGTKIYATSNRGLEAIIPGDANRNKAIDSAMSLAQKEVEKAGKSPDVVRVAKDNTEIILKGMLAAIGWKANFKWK